jgi:hypothetical protein
MSDRPAKPADASAPATEMPSAVAAPPVAAAAKGKKLPETTEAFPWHSNHEVKKESNPFLDKDWYNRIYAWAGMFVRVVIIVGAVFSVVQFMTAREEKRVERTLGLVDLWDTPENQAAVTAVSARLAEINEANRNFLPEQPTAEQLANYYSSIGIAALRPDPANPATAAIPQQFERVLFFLNRMAACVEGNLCSGAVADDFFIDYARSFWTYFAGHVEERRRAAPGYAEPLEAYLTKRPAAQ